MPDRIIRESALTSEHLSQVSDFAERLFWRLTTVADDYGRFSANAAVIAGRCMPLIPSAAKKIPAALAELQAIDTIRLYEIEGKLYGFFPCWSKYQQTRAKKSKYPDPPTSADKCLQIPADANNCSNGASAPLPHTHSLLDSRNSEKEGESEGKPHEPAVTCDEIVEAWHEIAEPLGLPAVRELSESRRKKLLLRIHEHPRPTWWNTLFANIRASPFCRGLVPPKDPGKKAFRVSLDWLIDNDTNALKVYEGRYGS